MSQKLRTALGVVGGSFLVGIVGYATNIPVIAGIGWVGFAVGAVLVILALRGRPR